MVTKNMDTAPLTTKELRERIVKAWQEECQTANDNGNVWCEDGTQILRDLGFIPTVIFDVKATFSATAYVGYDAIEMQEQIRYAIENHYYSNRFNVANLMVKVTKPTENAAPIDEMELDAAIALVREQAKDYIRRYAHTRGGLGDAIRNTLTKAGVPLPEKKKQTYTVVIEGTSDMTPTEVARNLERSIERYNIDGAKVTLQTA